MRCHPLCQARRPNRRSPVVIDVDTTARAAYPQLRGLEAMTPPPLSTVPDTVSRSTWFSSWVARIETPANGHMTEPQIEPVSFMNTQGGDDLIVSFAIPLAEPGEVASLILMRSPKFEPFLPAEDHGVAV